MPNWEDGRSQPEAWSVVLKGCSVFSKATSRLRAILKASKLCRKQSSGDKEPRRMRREDGLWGLLYKGSVGGHCFQGVHALG